MAHVYKLVVFNWSRCKRINQKIQSRLLKIVYFRVTRTLFTLGELTLADPEYTGPFFDLDKIAKEVNDKVIHMTFFFLAVLVAQTFKKSPKFLGLAPSRRQCQHFWTHLLLKPPPSECYQLLDSWIKKWFKRTFSGDQMAEGSNKKIGDRTSKQTFEHHFSEQIFESNSFKGGSHCIRPDRDSQEGAGRFKIFTNQCKSIVVQPRIRHGFPQDIIQTNI